MKRLWAKNSAIEGLEVQPEADGYQIVGIDVHTLEVYPSRTLSGSYRKCLR